MRYRKKFFALMMSLAMVLTCIPALAFAADEAVNDAIIADDDSRIGQEAEISDTTEDSLDNSAITEDPVTDAEENQTAEAVREAAPLGQTFAAGSGLADSDELLEQFIERKVSEQTRSGAAVSSRKKAASATRGSRLQGVDAEIYKLLVPEIRAIAEGESDESIFRIPISIIIGDDMTVTADELGLSSFTDENGITVEAKNALGYYLLGFIDPVMNALMADYPYEFYWFDKTESVFAAPSDYMYSDTEAVFNDDAVITLLMAVSADYSVDEETGTTDIDTVKTRAAAAFAKNAANIINNNAGKTDLEKLNAYRDAICENTSYNREAAENESIPYGNPWQMIWVFDDNEATNVVCEGYAKAFQFLCDNTDFSGNINCFTVSGRMAGGTGAGDHMWNILSMDDGQNYLADITNCDDGSVGAPDQLFLAGCIDGSFSEYYAYFCNGMILGYAYDRETLLTYTEDELTIAVDPEAQARWAAAVEARAEATRQEEARKKAAAAEAARQGTYDKKIPKVKISKPAAKKQTITAKWKKLTSKQLKNSKATKYEIWICPNKKFAASDTKSKIVAKSKSSFKFKGLKKNTKYYVKVRAVRISGGVKYVGKWSSVKTIKTKKK